MEYAADEEMVVVGGRRAQRSAPSSRFVTGESRREERKGRAGSVHRPSDRGGYAAPHTADGLPQDSSKSGGVAGGRRAGNGMGYKPYTGKVSTEYMHLGRLKCARGLAARASRAPACPAS